MQKVITVTSHVNLLAGTGMPFVENTYPTLDKYLEEGYKIIQTIPTIVNAPNVYGYSLTFILEKVA